MRLKPMFTSRISLVTAFFVQVAGGKVAIAHAVGGITTAA
jgi:hypothetical protein